VNFANPGLLGPFSRFKDRFVTPVERGGDQDGARRLRQITAPFLLRRLKSDVATELPEKQESIVACTLMPEQENLYRQAVKSTLDNRLGGCPRMSTRCWARRDCRFSPRATTRYRSRSASPPG
jgi:SNF2 family DNA or RNA helicase